jgi:microcystin-dependent protein
MTLHTHRIFAWTCGLLVATTLAPASARAQQSMLGEIRFVGFNFAPPGWANCDGQLMSVAGNPELFALLGNKFGGNGTTTFALPDLRGRSPVDDGQGPGLSARVLGQKGGTHAHTLTTDEMPLHSHAVSDHTHPIPPLAVNIMASSAPATSTTAAGNILATAALAGGGGPKVTNIYAAGPPDVALGAGSVTVGGNTEFAGATTATTGNGTPYEIVPPYLTVKCIIAIQGTPPGLPLP